MYVAGKRYSPALNERVEETLNEAFAFSVPFSLEAFSSASPGSAALPPPLIPVPQRDCPVPVSEPRPGCFYRIQHGAGGLLKTVSRAYGDHPTARQMSLAALVNNHPYNRRFWVTGVWPFEDGQITFRPKFTSRFEDQARGVGSPLRAPSGSDFASIWIPPVEPAPRPDVKDCTDRLVLDFWLAAARNAFDAWLGLEGLSMLPEPDQGRAWASGQERIWFGAYTPAAFKAVRRRMGRIEAFFRRPRITLKCSMSLSSYARSSPGVNRITLGKLWLVQDPLETASRHAMERTQTFIHEAAHIVGVNSTKEKKWYGLDCSRCLALQNPARARMSPDNYAYYAMSQALVNPLRPATPITSGSPVCKGCV